MTTNYKYIHDIKMVKRDNYTYDVYLFIVPPITHITVDIVIKRDL